MGHSPIPGGEKKHRTLVIQQMLLNGTGIAMMFITYAQEETMNLDHQARHEPISELQ